MSRSGPRNVPFSVNGGGGSGCASSMLSLVFGSAPGRDSSSVNSGNAPTVKSWTFEMPSVVTTRIGYTPTARSASGSTRNVA